MLRRSLAPAFLLVLAATTVGAAHATRFKWPPWLSIESPVNPFDAATRDALFLVRAAVREGTTSVADLSGSAEGLVDGKRQSVALRFETTTRPDVYAVRRQWPASGTWVVRVTLLRTTTAIVTLDRSGAVAGVRVPTQMNSGMPLPRAVAAREIDSTLADAAARR